jgi:hypothetical protein
MNRPIAALTALILVAAGQAADRKPSTHDLTFAKTPLAFEPNAGQDQSSARFLARGAGYSVKLEPSRALLSFGAKQVALGLVNASPRTEMQGDAPLPGTVNYFETSDPKTWFTSIPTYSKVSYKDVYPGIGLAFHGNGDRLEYDFLVDPGADAAQIRFQLIGADKLSIDAAGNLVLHLGQQDISLLKPVAWQPTTGGNGREIVQAAYTLNPSGQVTFALGPHDAKRALVIDPIVSFVYSGYVGYSASAVAVDSSGNTYVTGQNGYYNSYYVTKFGPTGTVIYTNTFGTAGTVEYPESIAIDSTGRAYIAGQAYTGLPTTSNAYQTSDPNSSYDGFLSVISASGSSLVYSTYLGGTASGQSSANGVAIDSSGNAYLTGTTGISNFPTTSGVYQTTYPGSTTGFIAKINPSLSGSASLIYSTFLGPAGSNPYAIALDSSGDTYVTGYMANGYPITAGAFTYTGAYSYAGGVFVTELNLSATALIYSAYLGYGTGYSIAVDGQGSAYVTGTVGYADFPTTPGAYQTTYAGGFVVKLPPGAASETYSTFLSGPSGYTGNNVTPSGLAIPPGCASACTAYIAGQTTTIDFPLVNAVQTFPSSSGDSGFVTELSATGSSALFSTYLSGATAVTEAAYDYPSSSATPTLAVDSSGNMSVIENVSGNDFPITIPGTQTNGVLAKIGPATAGFTWATPSSVTFTSQVVGVSTSISGGTQTITLRDLSNTGITLSSIQPNPSTIFSESDNCSGTIPAGGYCTLSIDFTPGAAGQRSGNLTVTSNAANSPTVFPLGGTGVDGYYLSPSPTSLTFGDQAVGTLSAPQTVTITNLGDESVSSGLYTGTSNFQELNNCPTQLAAGASCTVSITFIPTLPGLISDYLYISPYGDVTLSGTGTVNGNATGLALSATSLNFGIENIGATSASQSIYITNIGTAPATIQSITASGDYSVSSYSCSPPEQLAPQSSCYVYVYFTPTATGTRTGTLTITDSTPASPHTASLTGTGQTATENLEFYPGTSIAFGNQPLGYASSTQVIYVYNAGTGVVTIDRVEPTGDFQIYQTNCEARTLAGITPGPSFSYCYVYVTFNPSALGARTGTLTILDSAANSPQVLNLSGAGITPTGAISATPDQLTFAAQPVGVSSSIQEAYITNPGNSPVTITGETPTGSDYAITYTNCPLPYLMSPGQSCLLEIAFTPTGTTNPRTGSIVVNSSAGNQTINLSGTGETATQSIGLTPTALTFGSQVVGQSTGAYYVYARNTGTETVTFTASPAITGTNAADFTLEPVYCNNGYTVAPASTCYFYVFFTPGAAGARSATITLTDTAGTQTMALSGTGVTTTPTYTLSSYQVPFNLQVEGTTSSLSNYIYFNNNGTTSVTMGNLALTGNFLIPIGYQSCNGQTISAGGSCYTYVEFAPASAGYLTGTLAFKNSAGTTLATATLAGYAPAPVYSAYIDPGALSYTPQVLGTSSTGQYVTLYNTGNLSMTVGTGTGTNTIIGSSTTGEFSAVSDYCSGESVVAGSSCYIYITFKPSSTGVQTGSVTFPVTYSNNTTANFTATVSGTGMSETDVAVLSPTAATFLDQVVGTTSSSVPLTLTNNGDLPFTVGTLTGTNTVIGTSTTGEFSGNGSGGYDYCSGYAVTAGGSCTVYVVFTPSSAGAQTGSISFPVTFEDNSTTTVKATLSGNGIAGTNSVQVSPAGIQFSTELVGTVSDYQDVEFTNTGSEPVVISADTVTGAFAIYSDGCAAVTVRPGDTCYVYITFNPTATGSATGTLTIGDNGSGGPHAVSLSGIGVPAAQPVSLSQTTVAFGNQAAGSAGSQTAVYLTNRSSSEITVTSLSLGGADAADFQLNAYTCASYIYSYDSCYFRVTFAPLSTATGALTASVTITYQGTGSPLTLTLTGTAVAPGPAVALAPSALTFPSTNVGSSAPYQTFSVTNTGSASLSNISVASTNRSEFPIVGDGCSGATLSPQQQCLVGVRFTPSLGGARSGSITVTDSAANSPQAVTLAGTGVGNPVATLNPTSLSFGNENLGVTSAAQTVSLTNTGSDILKVSSIAVTAGETSDFASTNNCPASLAPNGSCTISVTFTPTVAGSRGATVTLTDNANNVTGSTQNIALIGTGVAVPKAAASPTALTFSSQNINTASAAQNVTLTNSGTGALAIASVAVSGTNASSFSALSGCGVSLPAGANCTVAVTFTPQSAGSLTATLTITDNANNTTGSTQTVSLAGAGLAVPQAAVSPASLTFGSENIGTSSAAQNVTLSNSGTGPLSIATVAVSGTNAADFTSVNGCGASLAVGANCTISLTFTPKGSGSRAATLAVTDNTNNVTGSTQTVALSGTGVAVPQAAVSPASLTFTSQNIGTTSPAQTATISNKGTGPLTIASISLGGADSVAFPTTNNCSASVPVGGSCTISVTFTPNTAGALGALITITDNSNNVSGSTQTISIVGTGVAVPLAAASPASLTFANQVVNTSSAPQYVTLSNTGTGPLAISSVALTGTNASSFTDVSGCGLSLPAGSTCTISVIFGPATTGSLTASLTITDNANNVSGSTQTVPVSGTAIAVPVVTSVSVTPGSGTGTTQTFSFLYSDTDGSADLSTVFALFNTSTSVAKACYIYYVPSSNLLYLENSAGTGSQGSLTPGSTATVSNSECTISGTGSSVTSSGNNLTVAVKITFQSTFTGAKTIYMNAASKEGETSGGLTSKGTWTP